MITATPVAVILWFREAGMGHNWQMIGEFRNHRDAWNAATKLGDYIVLPVGSEP